MSSKYAESGAERPKLIAFEGSDACGKTTVMREVAPRLRSVGLRVKLLDEFGENQIGRLISREVARSGFWHLGESMPATAAALLALLGDYLFRLEAIAPKDQVVLIDRYILSLLEIQGEDFLSAAPMPWEGSIADRRAVLERLTSLLPPAHLTIVLDVSADIQAERLRARGEPLTDQSMAILMLRNRRREALLSSSTYRSAIDPLVRINGDRAVSLVTGDALNQVQQIFSVGST